MSLSSEIASVFQDEFKDDAKISQISPDLRGKCIVIYGGNNLGKTKQSSKLKNPVFMPFEKGMNAISGALVLKNTKWSDVRKNVRKLSKKKFTKLLEAGEQITVIWDGVERAGIYCQKYIEEKYDAFDVADARNGFGAWSQYEKEYWSQVDQLLGLGYTVVFICHEQDKDDKKYPKGDKRCIAPVVDNADIVVHLEPNGIDEKGNEILSSGYLVETDKFFARSRFPYVEKYMKEFTAENLEKIIVEGINKQIEIEGIEAVDFATQKAIYEDKEEASHDELVESIRELYLKLDEKGMLNKYELIAKKHLGDTPVSETSENQIEPLICIKQDIEDLLEELEE